MQELRRDGSEVLTPDVTMKEVEKAIKDPRNVSVRIHKPGATFTSKSDCCKYKVLDDGEIAPLLSKEDKKKKRKAQKNARRKSR